MNAAIELARLTQKMTATKEWISNNQKEVKKFKELMEKTNDSEISDLGFGSVRIFFIDELIKLIEKNQNLNGRN